jgi:hypothetical protein
MQKDKVFIVHLRRPRSKKDSRSDPFWEFGSFGIKCHGKNLMNRRHAEELEGARLAFAQGGKLGTRLVYLTPPVTIRAYPDRIEAKWSPGEMPFRYSSAPILVSNNDDSDFRLFGSSIKIKGCPTYESQFAADYMARAKPIDPRQAGEVIRVYGEKRKKAPTSAIASSYAEALPSPLLKVDDRRRRKGTYEKFLREARQPQLGDPSCSRRRPGTCPPRC